MVTKIYFLFIWELEYTTIKNSMNTLKSIVESNEEKQVWIESSVANLTAFYVMLGWEQLLYCPCTICFSFVKINDDLRSDITKIKPITGTNFGSANET